MTKEKLGFAVMGCGRMGKRRMQAVAKHPRAELVCVADENQAEAEKAAQQFRCPHFPSLEASLKEPGIDCVILSIPNKFHVSEALAALQQGKHVFCEKPLAVNPQESWAMVKAARDNGCTLKVGSNLRFFPSVLKAKELLDSGAIGEPTFLRSWIGNSGWQLQNPWFRDPDVIGGGTNLDNGCHMFDLVRWFLGEVRECMGMTSTTLLDVAPLEDNAIGIFTTLTGKLASVHSSWTDWVGYMYMEVYGSEGYIYVDNRAPLSKVILGSKEGQRQEFDSSSLPPTSFKDEVDAYVENILQGHQPLPSGFDGLRAVQMAWGIYESARTGRKINLFGEAEEGWLRGQGG